MQKVTFDHNNRSLREGEGGERCPLAFFSAEQEAVTAVTRGISEAEPLMGHEMVADTQSPCRRPYQGAAAAFHSTLRSEKNI